MSKYTVPSQEEIKNQKPEYVPLKPGNYIVKVMKIDFHLKSVWNAKAGAFDPTQKKFAYDIIALPYGMENGDNMLDVDRNLVEPLTRWLWKEVNPFAVGFLRNDNTTPTNMRALLCYLSGQDIAGKVVPEDFILIKGNEEITDKKLREEFLAEQDKNVDERKMPKEGYKAIPDIRMYEGKYVACAIEADITKGRNKITRFSAVSSKFVPVEEKEKIDKFWEAYKKMQERKDQFGNGSPVTSNVSADKPITEEAIGSEEIGVEEVPF